MPFDVRDGKTARVREGNIHERLGKWKEHGTRTNILRIRAEYRYSSPKRCIPDSMGDCGSLDVIPP